MRRTPAVLIGVLVLTGCRAGTPIRLPSFPRPAPAVTQSADPQREVIRRTIVEPLAQAIRSGQSGRVHPLLHPDLDDSERRDVLDPIPGARSFQLASLEMTIEPDVIPISGSSAFIDVDGRYSIEGLHSKAGKLNFRAKMAVKKQSGKWRISGMNWTNPPPWIVAGPFVRTTAGRSIIVASADFPTGELVPLIEEARGRLASGAAAVAEGHLIAVPPNSEDFLRIGGGAGAAVVITYYEWNGKEFSVKTPFLLVDPETFVKASVAERRLIVLHEMTHLGLAQRTTPFVPSWLSEGLAMHFSDDLPLQVFRQNPSLVDSVGLPDLTRALDLGAHDVLGTRATVEYAFSAATVALLIERYGEAATIDFLSSYQGAFTAAEIKERIPIFSTGGLASRLTLRDLGVEATDRLLSKKFSTSTDDLDGPVKDWIRTRIG